MFGDVSGGNVDSSLLICWNSVFLLGSITIEPIFGFSMQARRVWESNSHCVILPVVAPPTS